MVTLTFLAGRLSSLLVPKCPQVGSPTPKPIRCLAGLKCKFLGSTPETGI